MKIVRLIYIFSSIFLFIHDIHIVPYARHPFYFFMCRLLPSFDFCSPAKNDNIFSFFQNALLFCVISTKMALGVSLRWWESFFIAPQLHNYSSLVYYQQQKTLFFYYNSCQDYFSEKVMVNDFFFIYYFPNIRFAKT